MRAWLGAGNDRRAQARGYRVSRYYQRLRCESLGISCSLALLDKSHDVTHFSYGYCAHCVLFSCIISTADADSIMIRAESKYSLFFRIEYIDLTPQVVPGRLSVVIILDA